MNQVSTPVWDLKRLTNLKPQTFNEPQTSDFKPQTSCCLNRPAVKSILTPLTYK
jgi:hypothetical protein